MPRRCPCTAWAASLALVLAAMRSTGADDCWWWLLQSAAAAVTGVSFLSGSALPTRGSSAGRARALGVLAFSQLAAAQAPYVMTDSNIGTAVAAWLSNSASAQATYGPISTWDTSGVTDMAELFKNADSFNEDISNWAVDSVTSMYQMFNGALAFDQDLGWCVDQDLGGVFLNAPCASTSCGVVQGQFVTASGSCESTPAPTAYYDGVHHTDVSIRTAVTAWLSDATAAEATYGHISTWKTGKVTDMSDLFCAENDDYYYYEDDESYCNEAAASFNEDIGAWDTSGVATMSRMLDGASAFNQDISGWPVHSVRSMWGMFASASAFNQDLSGWAVHSVTEMSSMFRGASAFDQDLGWCVDDAVSLVDAFYGTKCASTCAHGDHQCESTSCGVVQMDNCDTPVVNAAHRLAGSSALLALALPLITNISLRPPPRSRPSRSRGAARRGAPRPGRA